MKLTIEDDSWDMKDRKSMAWRLVRQQMYVDMSELTVIDDEINQN